MQMAAEIVRGQQPISMFGAARHCNITRSPARPQKRGAKTYHNLPVLHKTCNSTRVPLLSAIETGLQSRWVVNAG
jgi:hypothetical protein